MSHAMLIAEVMKAAVSITREQSQRRQDELALAMRKLEVVAQMERDQAKAAFLMKLAAASENLQNRKMDLVFETFRATRALIDASHMSLLEERNDLKKRRHEVDEEREVRLMRRIGEIRLELIELIEESKTLSREANRMAQLVESDFRLPEPLLLV